MQISMTKASCKHALKELKHWIKPEKVIMRTKLKRIYRLLSLRSLQFHHSQNFIDAVHMFQRSRGLSGPCLGDASDLNITVIQCSTFHLDCFCIP